MELQRTNQPTMSDALVTIGKIQLKIPATAEKFLLVKDGDSYQVQEIATLGESDVLVKRGENGEIRMIIKEVILSEKRGHLKNIGWDDLPTWMITIDGYNYLNQFAALTEVCPPIVVGGREQTNPYKEFGDDDNVKQAIARVIVIGYSPAGNLVATDCLRIYDPHAYYIQDLISKERKAKAFIKYGLSVMCPFAPDAPVKRRKKLIYVDVEATDGQTRRQYYFEPIKGSNGLWLDPSSEDVQKMLSQYNSHIKFCDANVLSLARRNARKIHPAIATTKVNPVKIPGDVIVKVKVYCYRHNMTRDEIAELTKKIEAGEMVKGLEVTRDEGVVTEEENRLTLATGTEEEEDRILRDDDQDDEKKVEGVKQPEDLIDRRGEIRAIAKDKGISDIELNDMAKKLHGSKLDSLTFSEQAKFLTLLKTITSGKKGAPKP